MRALKRAISEFCRNRRGNIAVITAMTAPVMLALAGAGYDYSKYYGLATELQSIADKSALAGAREYIVTTNQKAVPKAVAENIAQVSLDAKVETSGAAKKVTVKEDESSVTVAITHSYTPTLLVGLFKNPLTINVDATAQAVGGGNICVITLEEASANSFSAADNATLSGEACAVYSNSTDPLGLSATGNSTLKTSLNCSAGGYEGNLNNFDPMPLTDCPKQEDPLAGRPEPSVGMCSIFSNLVADITATLLPGVYCGGLTIEGNSTVTLMPGIYVIKDGDLDISSTSRVTGNGVGFYFAGKKSVLNIGPDVTLDLTAPETGPMAGILMFQDRASNPNQKFTISSNDAETLVGTIYLPNGRLYIDADQPVANESAYTAIIAKRLELASSVNLVLNSDYEDTNVPVPAGLAGVGGNLTLRE